jgi:ubiquinone/menaquinone biosynthesis C-methylase UbiE
MTFSKFFSNIQEAPWYRSFLNPVINEISNEGKLLDIGTGSGKLIQVISTDNGIECIGVDTNSEMINESKIKLKETNVKVIKIEANKKLPFKDHSFNYITICSVLFHLTIENIDLMLNDAQRLLKKDGKIIVLTPTGKGTLFTLSKAYLSLKNLSVYIWFYATRNRAKIWSTNKYLEQYTTKNKLQYSSQIVMNGFAQLEIIN